MRRKIDREAAVYSLHHMHHFKTGRGLRHEVHHCPLFSRPGLKGKIFTIIHVTDKNGIRHCVKEKFTGFAYDHAGKRYQIKKSRHKNKTIYEIMA